MCIALCTIVAHNIAQNRHDNFPSYPPDNHHCSDDVYLREGGLTSDQSKMEVQCNRKLDEENGVHVKHQALGAISK